MNIGALDFQMMADMSQLKRDMDEAKRSVTSAMDGIESAVGIAKTAFVGLIGLGSVGMFAGVIQGSINAAASLSDLSKSTGLSVDALSRFSDIGRTTGTSAEAIAGMMNKLSKSVLDAKDGTHGAGVAITSLGLNFNEFQRLSPDEKLRTLAVAMNEVGMGSDKSAAAWDLMGKSGAANIPFLTDMANAGATVARVTKEQAEAADNYEDNLTLLKAAGTDWQNQIAMGIVPALSVASTALLDVAKETGGFGEKIAALSKDGTLASWTTSAITGLTYVSDAFEGVGTVVKSSGLVIGAWIASLGNGFSTVMESMRRATDGDFRGAMDTMASGLRQQKTITQELGDELDKTWSEKTLGSKLRDRMADIKAAGVASEAIKPQMDISSVVKGNEAAHKASTAAQKEAEKQAQALAAEIKKQEENYVKLNASINAKTAAMLAELNQSAPLTEAQKAEVKLLADLESGTVKMTAEQKLHTLATIANYGQVEKQVAEYKKQEAEIKANTAANDDLITKLEQGTIDIEAQITQVKDHTSKIGLNKDELALLSIQKDLDRAATLEQKVANAEYFSLSLRQIEAYKAQAAGLRDLAGLKEQGIHVQAARDADVAWQKTTMSIATGLGAALGTAIGQGKDLWLTFRDYMVKTILDGAIKNALTSVIGEGINWLMSSLSGIKIGGGTGGSILSGITSAVSGGISSIGSGISSIGSGITSALGIGGGGTAVAGGATTSAVTGGGSIVATDLGLLGSGATTGGTTGVTAAGTSTLASLAGPAFFAAIGLKLLSGSSLPTKVGGTYSATEDGVTKLYGNGTGGEFPNGAQQSALSDTLSYINTQLAAAGSTVKVTSLNGGGESGEWSTQSYSFAGGTLSNGLTFGTPTQMGDNLGIATPEEVFAAYVADLKAAASQAIELGLTGSITTPLADHVFKEPEDTKFEGFANGGDFMGGWRIVGERGPELEATGPSRIFDAATTASMLRSGGASNDEVITELRLVKEALLRMEPHARRTADATNGNPDQPVPVEVLT